MYPVYFWSLFFTPALMECLNPHFQTIIAASKSLTTVCINEGNYLLSHHIFCFRTHFGETLCLSFMFCSSSSWNLFKSFLEANLCSHVEILFAIIRIKDRIMSKKCPPNTHHFIGKGDNSLIFASPFCKILKPRH